LVLGQVKVSGAMIALLSQAGARSSLCHRRLKGRSWPVM